MKIVVQYLLILFSLSTATAQRTTITDSLINLLALSKPDTSRVILLKTLSQYYHRANPDTAKQLAEEGLLLARHLKYRKGEAECLLTKGIVLEQEGLYPQALEVLLQSKSISERIGNIDLIAKILRAQGKLFASQGDFYRAKNYLYQAKEMQEKLHGKSLLSNTLKVIGEMYLEQHQLDSARFFLNQSYQILEDKNSVGIDDILKDLGQVEAKMGNDSHAMTYFRNSVPYSIADNDWTILNEAYLGIARLFQKSGSSDSGVYYSRKALDAAQKINYSKGILGASQLLADIYEPINEREAFRYFKIATAVKDSVFNADKAKQVQNLEFLEQQRLQSIEGNKRDYENRMKIYALLSALGVFLLLAFILWRSNRIKHKAKINIESAYNELKSTQAQLIQSEKMASLGELTAGIAHEIQNPLNFVNNFSEVNSELIAEMKQEMENGNINQAKLIAADIQENEQKIIEHGKRAAGIVKGMLQHSRTSTGVKEPTDINQLADEYLRLAFHGFKAKDKTFNATLETNYDPGIGMVNVIPQDIGRVILNLITNAFYSVTEKNMLNELGYDPKVSVSTKRLTGKINITVRDNGIGVSSKVFDRIFQPFFTTKPTGNGTGLGLSLSYDIIKSHSGELTVKTKEGEFAEFIIELPA